MQPEELLPEEAVKIVLSDKEKWGQVAMFTQLVLQKKREGHFCRMALV